jgi:ABC-type transporter Mla maintaining outer membrane lipid asymmetry permease subunit MlaE
MTALLIVALVLLTLLGLPLFVALAGGSLLATYNAGLAPGWYWRPAARRSA